MKKIFYSLCSILSVFLILGCAKEKVKCKKRADYGALVPGCYDSHRPVILVHGFLGAGDNYANMIQRFLQNGYCPEKLIIYDWNTQSGDITLAVDNLSRLIDSVLESTGFSQIDLIGHSMGGRVGMSYLNRDGNAQKVAHYIHAASFPDAKFPEGTQVMTLSSYDDTVFGFTDIEGATNVEVPGADHIQVVTVPFSFKKAYEFFNDGVAPESVEIVTEDDIKIEGKAITIGENLPVPEARVEIYPVEQDTGERITSKPVACFITDSEGRWGIFEAQKDTNYEIYFETLEGEKFHYYRQPFLRTQHAVYLRSLGSGAGMVGSLLASIAKYSDNYSVMVMFSANQAVYYGRDSASIDGNNLATAEIADPKQTSLAFFFGDENQNMISDFIRGPLSAIPFLEDIDYYIPTDTRKPVKFEFNGKFLSVPNWKSESEGLGIAVFDY